MATYEEYYQFYKTRIEQNMKTISVDTPEINRLAVAMNNVFNIEMSNYDYQEAMRKLAEREDEDDSNIFFTIAKIAVIAAVAYFAPPLLAQAFPTLCAAGSVGGAVGTGVAVGTADAATQGVGIAFDVQDHFSFNEVIESAVSAGVGVGAVELGIAARAAVVVAAAASTQGAEMLVGLREKFDPKAVGLQIAASVIASGMSKVAPELKLKFGESGAQIAVTTANTAINSVLQSAVYNAPLDIASITANIAGTLAGNKLGSKIIDSAQEKPQSSVTGTHKSDRAISPKLDFDKMCTINDTRYSELPKMTPVQPTSDVNDYVNLMMNGQFQKAQELVIDMAKTRYTSTVTDLPKVDPMLPKDNLGRLEIANAEQPLPTSDSRKDLSSTSYVISEMNRNASTNTTQVAEKSSLSGFETLNKIMTSSILHPQPLFHPEWIVGTRTLGALQSIGGLFQTGSSLLLAALSLETGIGPVFFGTTAASGLDNAVTGAKIAMTGEDQNTYFVKAVERMGGNPKIATLSQSALDLAVPVQGLTALKASEISASYASFFAKSAKVGEGLSAAEHEFYTKAKLIGQYDYKTPGMLSKDISITFIGGRYKSYQLTDDVILQRAGTKQRPFGQSFSFDKPISEIQTRIDKAIKPVWPGGGISPIDTGFAIKIPKGTIVHVGDVANQGGVFLGGTRQVVVEAPWQINGIEVMDTYTLQQEKLWNTMTRK